MSSDGTESWQIIYIPPKPPVDPKQQPTVNVFASEIEPKFANKLVRRLNQIAPLEDLRHVKRVQKKCNEEGKTQLSVILCLASEDGNLDEIPHDVQEVINSYQLSLFVTKVCKYAALTKEEWEEQCKLWPTSYHPPTYNIDGITGFGEDESRTIFNYMKYAIDLAKFGDNLVFNAAVIVDPVLNQVAASARDQIYNFCPTDSRSSEADSVRQDEAKSTSSHPNINGGENHEYFHTNGSIVREKKVIKHIACLYPWEWEEQCRTSNFCLQNPLWHAAIVAIDFSAVRDRCLFPISKHHEGTVDSNKGTIAGSPAKRQKTGFTNVMGDKKDDIGSSDACSADCCSSRPYLCTGYDIYLVWEPCPMCAMALVHQRLKRIFFAFPNPRAGALGSVQRLQGEKSLNHHYAVFRVLIPENFLEIGDQQSTMLATRAKES